MKLNQKGFSIAETLLVIAVIGVILIIGWLVYGNQSDKTSDRDMKSQASQQEQKQEAPNETVTYFEINELGVKFKPSEDLSGLYYVMGNDNKTAYFSLDELKNTDCAADKTAQVALTRYTDADFENDPSASKEQARKIGDYYFFSAGGQAACSEDGQIQEKATQLRTDITQALPSTLVIL